jgi:hypothetical protein
MKRAMMYITPIALFAMWIWIIVQGIDEMSAQERNNHAIARLMRCEYHGRLDAVPDLLIFECASGIELHEEIQW